jgi:hypothetical protein
MLKSKKFIFYGNNKNAIEGRPSNQSPADYERITPENGDGYQGHCCNAQGWLGERKQTGEGVHGENQSDEKEVTRINHIILYNRLTIN